MQQNNKHQKRDKYMRLSEVPTGQEVVIVKVLGYGAFCKRIIEMGFVRGKKVKVLLNAPLKDPVKYKILDYEVSLRRSEAALIEVVTTEEAENILPAETADVIVDEDIRMQEAAVRSGKVINIALVGNPNCGKTSLFNIASGAHEHVGNYSGVTVDAKQGHFDYKGYRFNIYDLPGTYSLSAYTPEELYVRLPYHRQTTRCNRQCRRSFKPRTKSVFDDRTDRYGLAHGHSPEYV